MLPEVNPEKKLTSETLPTTVKIGDIIQKAHKELDFQNTSKDSQINDAKQNRASTITPMSTFKVCIVGDGGVGKTTFVGKLNNGSFERKYIPTIGVDVKTLRIETNAGSVLVNMWDVAGQEKFGILRTSYYTKTDALILMFDVTSRMTYKNIPNWHAEVTKENPDVLCVILGNKVDLAERQVKPRTITFHRKKNIQYYELSVKSNYNIHKPLTYLLQRLTKNSELVLLENHPAKVEEFVETSDDVKSSCDQQ
jgi:GTP-binding nuclear protein Ran